MNITKRACQRYDDVGRVEIKALCAFPGALDNVSCGGCKVHYFFPITVNFEIDYEVNITFARAATEGQFKLLCHAQWSREINGATEIGFKVLPTKESARFCNYVSKLGNEQCDLQDEISEHSPVIIE